MTKLKEQPTYTLSDGTKLKLAPVPPFLIHSILANNEDAPQIPTVEYERRGKKVYEQNPDDETYKKRKEEYDNQKNFKLLLLLFTEGIVGSVEDYIKDKSQIESIRDITSLVFGNDYNSRHFKYTWLTSQLNEDEIEELQEAIQSLSTPTQESQEDSKSDT